MCHGTVIEPHAIDPNRHAHAWVEANERAYDWQLKIAKKGSLPIKDFYELFRPKHVKKYTVEKAMIMQLRHKHHGPWK